MSEALLHWRRRRLLRNADNVLFRVEVFYPQDRGRRLLLIIGNFFPNWRMSHPRRLRSLTLSWLLGRELARTPGGFDGSGSCPMKNFWWTVSAVPIGVISTHHQHTRTGPVYWLPERVSKGNNALKFYFLSRNELLCIYSSASGLKSSLPAALSFRFVWLISPRHGPP
jgi:hypothetical protein